MNRTSSCGIASSGQFVVPFPPTTCSCYHPLHHLNLISCRHVQLMHVCPMDHRCTPRRLLSLRLDQCPAYPDLSFTRRISAPSLCSRVLSDQQSIPLCSPAIRNKWYSNVTTVYQLPTSKLMSAMDHEIPEVVTTNVNGVLEPESFWQSTRSNIVPDCEAYSITSFKHENVNVQEDRRGVRLWYGSVQFGPRDHRINLYPGDH